MRKSLLHLRLRKDSVETENNFLSLLPLVECSKHLEDRRVELGQTFLEIHITIFMLRVFAKLLGLHLELFQVRLRDIELRKDPECVLVVLELDFHGVNLLLNAEQ